MPSTHQIGTAALFAWLTVAQQTTHLENMCLALGSSSNILVCSQRVRHIHVNVHVLSTNPLSCTINHILVFCSITYERLFLDSTSKVYVSALSAQQGHIDGLLLRMHKLLKSFLKCVEHL